MNSNVNELKRNLNENHCHYWLRCNKIASNSNAHSTFCLITIQFRSNNVHLFFLWFVFFFVYSKAEGIHEIGRRSSGDTLNVTECVCVERVITGQKDGHKIV